MATTASATPTFQSVSAGGNYSCGLTTAGFAFCWGRNDGGQLGNGTNTNSNVPVAVVGGPTFRALSSFSSNNCGTTRQNSAAFCWGLNNFGQLGNGTNTNSNVPVAVSGGPTSFGSVSAGSNHSCGVSRNVAYCWGWNNAGRLGNGTTTDSNVPVVVSGGLTFETVSAGAQHSCGVAAGVAFCWGPNSNNRLGHGGPAGGISTVPVAVSGGLFFQSVSVGNHTCGITFAGAAYCWGTGGFGALGDGTNNNSNVPVAVSGGLSFRSVSAGAAHSCGLTTVGAVFCWGLNNVGQLGHGTNTSSNVPLAVMGGLTFESVVVGSNHSCGVAAGTVYCWGGNVAGALGDGTNTGSNVPVLVDVTNIAEPIIDPIVGNFFNIASNAGEPFVSKNSRVMPLVNFSQTVDSGLATSQLNVGVTNNPSETLIAITNLLNIQVGGNNAGLSFSMQFDVLQEAAYEIFGGMSVSTTGVPETSLSHQESISLTDLSPFTELYNERDAALNTTPVNFTLNDVNEGNLSDPDFPTRGSRIGVLAPGRYEIIELSESFSRGGGFSLTGRTDFSIRFTPTGSAPGTLLEQLGTAVTGVGPGNSLADKVALARTYLAVPDVQSTCAILGDFLNQVSAQRDKKLTPALADQLTADAQAIMTAIECN